MLSLKRNGAPFLRNGCAVLTEYAAADAVQEERYDFAENLLNMRKLTKEEIAQAANISVEEVEELAKELQA